MKSQYDASKYEQYIIKAFLVFICIVMMLLMYACSPHYYKGSDKPIITHVLALTSEGDTLKIPINDIKPNVVYNVIGYDWYQLRPGYYNRWADPYYHPRLYKPHKSIGSGNINYNNNNNNNKTNSPAIKPAGSVTPPPTPVNPRKRN